MRQLWINAAFVLLAFVGLVQCDDDRAKICANAPKIFNQEYDVIKEHVHHLFESDSDGNETRRCCGIYGCFSSKVDVEDENCQHYLLPFCQDQFKIKFYLWTKETGPNYEIIDPEDEDTLLQSKMTANSKVVFLISGYLVAGDMLHIRMIKDAFLERKPNIMFISVDWVNATRLPYMRALANTQIVGAITARFILQLEKNYNIHPEDIHIIGIDIGAHTAGEIGKRIPDISRITGLDPPGWMRHSCSEKLGISMTDATFIDIIHTNSRSYGTPRPRGHLDIYINGALEQPACMGCPGCNHSIVIFYYLETIKKDLRYYAYQCDNYENFLKGKCFMGCGKDGKYCAPMGFRAHEWYYGGRERLPTLMFMSMGTDENHYHLYHYYVEINCLDDKYRLWRYGRNLDKLEINLIEGNKSSGYKEIYSKSITEATGSTITSIITTKEELATLTGVGVKWTPHANKKISETCEMSDTTNRTILEDGNPCLEFPFQLKSIQITNLEYGKGKTFFGMNQRLLPNEELIITC